MHTLSTCDGKGKDTQKCLGEEKLQKIRYFSICLLIHPIFMGHLLYARHWDKCQRHYTDHKPT